MKQTEKCISQPLAKKIHDKHIELGMEVPESELVWIITMTSNWHLSNTTLHMLKKMGKVAYPSYDTSELGEMLKEKTFEPEIPIRLPMWNSFRRKWGWTNGWSGNEAEARGANWLWLLENGYITTKRGQYEEKI